MPTEARSRVALPQAPPGTALVCNVRPSVAWNVNPRLYVYRVKAGSRYWADAKCCRCGLPIPKDDEPTHVVWTPLTAVVAHLGCVCLEEGDFIDYSQQEKFLEDREG